MKDGGGKAKTGKALTPPLPELSDTEDSDEEEPGKWKEIDNSEREEGERVEKGKETSTEKGKKTQKRRIGQFFSVETLSDSEEGEVPPSKEAKTHECDTIGIFKFFCDCTELEMQ